MIMMDSHKKRVLCCSIKLFNSFSMFSSPPPYTNLVFQDATTQLKVIEPSKRHYAEYLGSDFLRARRIVDCHAGNEKISASILTLIVTYLIFVVFY